MASPDDKAQALKAKTDLVRRTFNYPETEEVIQDYSCSIKRTLLVPGKLYITANFLSFIPMLGDSTESISFRKVNDMKKDTTILFSNAITLNTSSQNILLGSFMKRDEAYALIYHLWKHPPLFYDPNAVEDEEMRQFKQQMSNGGGNNNNSNNGSGKYGSVTVGGSGSGSYGSSNGSFNGGSGNYNSGSGNYNNGSGNYNSGNGRPGSGQHQQQHQYTKVDTESTKQALRIAHETKETGISTMNELSYQAELIDQIENNVENIHFNLDKSEKLLKGIESFGGQLSNSFSKDKLPDRDNHRPMDRSLRVRQRDEPSVEIDILEKLQNDMLQPGFIQYLPDKFVILDANKKPTPTGTYGYDQVEFIVVRARHFHLDFRFMNKSRFRLCSSYIQNIVNEFVLRSNGKIGRSAKIVFEPGVKEFAYGNPTIRFIPAVGRQSSGTLFGRTNTMGVSNVIKNAPEEVKSALLEQDKDLDEISALLGDIHGIARTIGDEADRQSNQLDRVTDRVDLANDRLHNNNKRIQKML